MNFSEYQEEAHKTAVYPTRIEMLSGTINNTDNYRNIKWIYPLIGLGGEVGELQNKLKKVIRDNKSTSRMEFVNELGDILWYLSELCYTLDINLEIIAKLNIQKLQDRMNRNVIKGEGDNR